MVKLYNAQGRTMIVRSMADARLWLNRGWSLTPIRSGGGGSGVGSGSVTGVTSGQRKGDGSEAADAFDVEDGEDPTSPTGKPPYADADINTLLRAYNDGRLSYAVVYAALTYQGLKGHKLSPETAKLYLDGNRPGSSQDMPQYMQVMASSLNNWLRDLANAAGLDAPNEFAANFLDIYWDDALSFAQSQFHPSREPTRAQRWDNPRTIMFLTDRAKEYLAQYWSFGPTDLGGGRGRGSGGGGLGSLRGSFDVDQLADSIRSMWNIFLRADPNVDPRGLAQAYVDQVVANPAQTIDFSTWVKGRMKEDPKWNFTFQSKPEGVSPEEYIQGYASAVIGTLGHTPESGSMIRSQAALNASASDLRGRMMLTPQVQRGSDFLSRIEDKFRSARQILGVMS